MTRCYGFDGAQQRYVDMLFAKVEQQERPDPALLNRLERILGFGRPPASVATAPVVDAPHPPTVEDVIKTVARHFGRQPAELVGDSRAPALVTVRHLAMRLARELTDASYPQIGEAFGRNHSTVIYACEQAAGLAVGDVMEAIEAEFNLEPRAGAVA